MAGEKGEGARPRRTGVPAHDAVVIGSLLFDEAGGRAQVCGRELRLPRREWALLSHLVARVGQVVSKDRLTSEIFARPEICPNAVEVCVSRLRRKLQPDGPDIWTVRGHGYMLRGN